MLVRVTNRCRMGCSHCLCDAQPDSDDHMNEETFRIVLDFVHKFGMDVVMLSGGEPTDHPGIQDLLDRAVFRMPMPYIVLLTNGQFLHEGPTLRRDRILDACDLVQVTNDPRYYPEHVADFDHPKVKFERSIAQVTPFGRAVTNGLATTRYSPPCFNFRSIVRTLHDLRAAVKTLRAHGKLCTPSINTTGAIVAGEAPSCPTIGNVWDDGNKIVQRVRGLRCDRCGLAAQLQPQHKQAIED